MARNFFVSRETFTVGSPAVLDDCVGEGAHRLLRLDVLCHNDGDADLVVGAPSARPDLFQWSASDGRYYLRDFVHLRLVDGSGATVATGKKRSFCLIDVERVDAWGRGAAQFTDCNVAQGISAGWADVYPARLPCQFLVIDGVGDGEYLLEVTIDAQRLVADAPAAGTRVAVRLRLDGDVVALLGGDVVAPIAGDAVAPIGGDEPPPLPGATALEGFTREVVDGGDLAAAAGYLSPAFVGHGVAAAPGIAPTLDQRAYLDALRSLAAFYRETRTTIDARVGDGAWTAIAWTRRCVPAGGARLTYAGVSVARVERGLIVEQWDVATVDRRTANVAGPLEP